MKIVTVFLSALLTGCTHFSKSGNDIDPYVCLDSWIPRETFDVYKVDNPERNILHGLYQKSIGVTGGLSLSLYPDNEYTIDRWCDICEVSNIEYGTWKFEKGFIELESRSENFDGGFFGGDTEHDKFSVLLRKQEGGLIKPYLVGSRHFDYPDENGCVLLYLKQSLKFNDASWKLRKSKRLELE